MKRQDTKTNCIICTNTNVFVSFIPIFSEILLFNKCKLARYFNDIVDVNFVCCFHISVINALNDYIGQWFVVNCKISFDWQQKDSWFFPFSILAQIWAIDFMTPRRSIFRTDTLPSSYRITFQGFLDQSNAGYFTVM